MLNDSCNFWANCPRRKPLSIKFFAQGRVGSLLGRLSKVDGAPFGLHSPGLNTGVADTQASRWQTPWTQASCQGGGNVTTTQTIKARFPFLLCSSLMLRELLSWQRPTRPGVKGYLLSRYCRRQLESMHVFFRCAKSTRMWHHLHSAVALNGPDNVKSLQFPG